VSVPRRAPKQGQRERLIEAMISLAGQHGYQTLSIAQVSARAGVSSATFYEQFADKEECLLEAYRSVTEDTLTRMQSALEEGEWARAARPAFSELLQSVQSDPDGGRVMFVEALTGGPRLREELALVLGLMEQSSEQLLDSAPAGGSTLDIPGRALMGAVRHVVSRHLRTHNEDRLSELTEDMLSWMGSYAVPADGPRWSTGPEATMTVPATVEQARGSGAAAEEMPRLPRGRHGLSAGVVARSQRTRILLATASVTKSKGYSSTTVADIVSSAGVAKEAFYRHFSDKEEAFLEAQQHPTQHVLDTLVVAYFSAEQWPERIWRGLRTLLELIAGNPILAHLRLVECYAAGPAAIRRAEDITRSFTIFLEEGYSQREQARELPRLCSQTISGAIFEVIQREVGAGRVAEIPRLLPQLAYISIAPFLGPEEAIERVREMTLRDLGESGHEAA
jgi:AcrR family transcriptional regulator